MLKVSLIISAMAAVLLVAPAQAQQSQCSESYFRLLLFSPPAFETYFVSFKVSYQGQERVACATVSEFQRFLNRQAAAPEGAEFLYLFENKAIPSRLPFDSLQLEWAKGGARLEQVARQGEKAFIEYFFNKQGCLRYERGINNADAMQYLQRWCIVAVESSYTGCLVLDSKVSPVR